MNHPAPTELLDVGTVPERSLLRLLATAHGRNINTGELVAHLSCEFTGAPSERLRQLAMLLSRGVPVVYALWQVPDVLDASTVMALHLAETDDTLPEMYQSLLATTAEADRDLRAYERPPGSGLVRTFIGIAFAISVVSFMMLFILPTFEKMFQEFGLDLPGIMTALISASQYFPTLLFLVLIGIIVYSLFNLHSMTRPMLNRFRPMIWQKQLVPSNIKLLSLLSIASHSRRSLGDGIATLAAAHPVAATRQKLSRANSRVEVGEDAITALATEKVITSKELSSLSLTDSDAAQSWLFRWFAILRWNHSRIWAPLVATTLSTFATLFLAFITAWMAFAVMMTLMSLVSGLS